MDHLAILKQPYFNKIISGEKTIETRWYKHKKAPFGAIKKGESVYLKETGREVSAKADVEKALFFEDLDAAKIRGIIRRHGRGICAGLSLADKVKDKKFCTLLFLKNVRPIKPFKIDKKGYGNMAAWITLKNIREIKSA